MRERNSNLDKTVLDRVAVILPAFNEGTKISETINDLKKFFCEKNIIVIDDGSTDDTFYQANSTGSKVIRHPVNLGQGAALQTGITYALSKNTIDFFLTFDADGQHSVDSALDMVAEIQKTRVDIILGSRFIENQSTKIPIKKQLILRLGVVFTRLNSGIKVTDTHNGLRVMNRRFAESLNLYQSGMAHASEIINQIKSTDADWKEIPAEVFYTEYSRRKGQSVFNAVNILTEMMFR